MAFSRLIEGINVKFAMSLLICLILVTSLGSLVSAQVFRPAVGVMKVKLSEALPEGAKLPELMTDAANKLFEQGLADPRRGEYREFEISSRSIWGGAGKVKIHGWVLSPEGDGRFGIGWNGLIYPVLSVGEKMDVRRDMLELLKADEDMRARQKSENPNLSFHRYFPVMRSADSASHKSLSPVKAALLLRLNEEALAGQLWETFMIGVDHPSSDDIKRKDPYLMLASLWSWALFDYSLTAHMEGADQEALSGARLLTEIRNKIEAEAGKRGFKLPDSIRGQKPGYLTFLDPLPALLADQERHAKADPNAARNSVPDLSGYPDKAARIAALIDRFDEVSARQWGQPGGVMLAEDPRVRALIEQGEEAVEPLLRVLESDTRLTRSVSFHRDFFADRHLITVSEAAYTALTRILKNRLFGMTADKIDISTPAGRQNVVAAIRAYLKKYGQGTVEERWYNVLADDSASMEEWTQAAVNIVNAGPVSNGLGAAWSPAAPTLSERLANGLTMRGEPLRHKTTPSVSELLARRMFELSARPEAGFPNQNLSSATNLAIALLDWDRSEAQMKAVQSFYLILKERYKTDASPSNRDRSDLIRMMVSLSLKRLEANDQAAFKEYAGWIGAMKPAEAGENTRSLFKPLWRYASHPAFAKVIAQMFEGAGDSPWLPLIDKENRQSFERAKLLETPMMNIKSFRRHVLEGLANKSVVGTLRRRPTLDADGFDLPVENTYAALLIGAKNASGGHYTIPPDDTRAARSEEFINIRVCDVYAAKLLFWQGAPKFQPYWTEAERDRAVTEFISFIGNHKGDFESYFPLD